MTEHDEQAAVITWAAFNEGRYPELQLLYAIPNAGKRSIGAARYMQAEGMKSGIPDLCLCCARHGYHGLYIEMKVRGGKLTDNQKRYITLLQEQDYLAIVAWGADEAIKIIEEYLI